MGSSTPRAAGDTGLILRYRPPSNTNTKPKCLRKLTSSNLSPTPLSSSLKRPSVSWTPTRMVFCLPLTSLLPSVLTERALAAEMVRLFATKMAGGSDDDDVILASFEAFEQDGKIDAETFRAQLMTFGNKFSASEVDDAFAEFKIDDGQIDA